MKFQKSIIITGLSALSLLAFNVQAQQTTEVWNPAGNPSQPSDDLWSDPANWTQAVLPGPGYKAVFNVPGANPGFVNSTAGGCQVSIGDGGPGWLVVESGGNLTAGDTSLSNNDNYGWTAIGYNNTAEMDIESGGSVTFNYHLWIGLNSGAHGTLNLNGGTATVAAAFGLGSGGGVGIANINGGTLYLNQANIIFGSASGDVLNIAGGTVSVVGNYTNTINSDIAAGKIVGYGGSGSLNVLYDSGLNRTLITAVPEPGTMQIAQQPVSASVGVGASFTNTVVVSGTPPFSYQWYKDDAPMAGQTNGSLIFISAEESDSSTNYFVVVTNEDAQSVTSAVVALNVGVFPTVQIVQQPVSATIGVGSSFTNIVLVSGGPPFSYQWYKDDAPLTGQTNASLIFSPVQFSDASTNYYVVVTNDFDSSVISAVVSLTVVSTPVITQNSAATNVTLFAGGRATFSIAASGALPLYFQWYSNNTAIVGATNASYALTNVQPPNITNTYYCVLTNTYGATNTLVAAVTVIPDPTAAYPQAVLTSDPSGYWRLNEQGPDGQNGPNDGVIAHDYWGGNNGIYTNTDLGFPGYDPNEPAETSAEFGFYSFTDCMMFDIPASVDFSAPTGANFSFSIECWVNAYSQTSDAGIVSRGVSGGEQFDLDTGANDPSHDFRFFVRDASGATHIVNSTKAPDGQWHYLVGVCDEAAGYVALYVDGVLAGTNAIASGSGILASDQGMKIGSRPGGSNPSVNTNQFAGNIADVAVYPRALSVTEVQDHFDAAAVPAKIVTQPSDVVADEFGNATFSATVIGTPPLTNQWYNGATGLPIAGATNTTLVLTNVQSSELTGIHIISRPATPLARTRALPSL